MPEPCPLVSAEQHAPRWELLRTAPDQLTAELWRGLLESEGIPTMLAPEDAVSFLGTSPMPVRLLVPGDGLAAARRILEDTLERPEEQQGLSDA